MAQNIPIFTPANPSSISNKEWNDYTDAVNQVSQDLETEIMLHDQNAHIRAPQSYMNNPTTATARLQCAVHVTAWLYELRTQRDTMMAGQAAAAAPP